MRVDVVPAAGQTSQPTSETIFNQRSELIKTPKITWLNFFRYPEFYESAASSCPPGLLVAFGPFLLALEFRFFRPFHWWAILLTFEGLCLIVGAGALWLAMALTHANFMTGYSDWKDTPLLYVLPAYGVLTGIACLVAPWVWSLRDLLSRLFAH